MNYFVKAEKSLRLAAVLIFILLLVVCWRFLAAGNYLSKEGPKLEVYFFDVGQGDAALFRTPYGQNVLIDGGPDRTILKRLAEVLPFWDRKIDLMILTHPHDDHVAGLVPVMENYPVEKIAYTGAVGDSPNYLAWLEKAEEKEIPVAIIDRPQSVVFGPDCRFEFLYPLEDFSGRGFENLNDSSIVGRLACENGNFLFAGDIEAAGEAEILAAGLKPDADVLKVGHHGSDTSTSEDFLAAVSPVFAVISVGADNSFGHPSLRVLSRLKLAGSSVLRTDLDGTIGFVSDGEEIRLE